MSHWFVLILLYFALSLSVTAQEDTTPPIQTSAWGEVVTFAGAEQASAPALWIDDAQLTAAWVGADDTGVYQYARAFSQGGLSNIERLPIPPVYPHDQRLIPAGTDTAHLFWIDAAYDAIPEGRRLWGAIVDTNLIRVRSEYPLSDDVTYHYDVITNTDSSLQIVWSGGLAAEPDLYTRTIDSAGRPNLPQKIASDADWPSLLRLPDGTVRLFWISTQGQVVFSLDFIDGTASSRQVVMPSVALLDGDRLTGFYAAAEDDTLYLLWQITGADGGFETWMSSSPIHTTSWAEPRPLHLQIDADSTYTTGFNGGGAFAASEGDVPVMWGVPARGSSDRLLITAQVNGELGVVYVQDGTIRGFQPVVTLNEPGLIGAPGIYSDRNRHLYLTWAQPTQDGYARLNLTTTR